MRRCYICDYSDDQGSFFANKNPSKTKVRIVDGEAICDECLKASLEVFEND